MDRNVLPEVGLRQRTAVLEAELGNMQGALAASEERYRQLFEQLAEGFAINEVVFDDDGKPCDYRFLEVNRTFEQLLGMSREQIVGRSAFEVFPDREPFWIDTHSRVALTGETVTFERYSPIAHRHYQLTAFRPKKGQVATLFVDITERKELENALRWEVGANAALAELSEALLSAATLEEISSLVLKQAQRFTGSTLGFAGYVDPRTGWLIAPAVTEAAWELTNVAGEKPGQHLVLREARGLWGWVLTHHKSILTNNPAQDHRSSGIPDGHIPVSRFLSVPALVGGSLVGLVALGNSDRDYSEKDLHLVEHLAALYSIALQRRQLEDQLLRAQRLETAGQLAGQVAHDFNNLLGPMVAYPELIKMRLPEGHPAREMCDHMLEAAEQMAAINTDMLALSRRGILDSQPVDLHSLVRQILAEIEPAPDSLVVEARAADDLLLVDGEGAQLLRVISNLVSNAREAMNDRGLLRVEIENVYIDQTFGLYNRVEIGEYVLLTISDTGCGIDPEVKSRIFDAFFTTKRGTRRRGSGLGLSVVQAIVGDHRGYLDLASELGKGSSFKVYLPGHRGTLKPAEEKAEIVGGRESVLVVDDDLLQREVVKQLLEPLGYQVETAESGEEALRLLASGPVDLVILDMIMPPGIGGEETYRRAVEMRPGQKAVLLSGFSESEQVREAQALGAGAYIRKPVTLERLAAAVRKELDGDAAVR